MEREEIERITNIIKFLKLTQHNLNEEWDLQNYEHRNLKRKNISDVWFPTADASNEFFRELCAYTAFVSERSNNLLAEIFALRLRTRVKQQNSILCKLQKYISAKEQGKVPIVKCINDLFGFRCIVSNDNEYEDIFQVLSEILMEDSQVRVVRSCHGTYKAIHVYVQEYNYAFPWELQIWKQEDAASNELSHAQYKQEYAEDSPVYQEKERRT